MVNIEADRVTAYGSTPRSMGPEVSMIFYCRPASILAQHRFVDHGDGGLLEPDAVKIAFAHVNEECNLLLWRLRFIWNSMDEVSAIAGRQVSGKDFQNFFAGENNVEDMLLQLNNFILMMLQPGRRLDQKRFDEAVRQWAVKRPCEKMVAYFYKVQNCVASGNVGRATFQAALNNFLEQVFPSIQLP
jgi:hypothetical protein